MTKLKPMSAVLIAVAMLGTPAMARESRLASRHLAENIDTSPAPGYFREGNGSRNYESRDVWGHWGAYYGPMIPSVP
jgi:hypothetical protein